MKNRIYLDNAASLPLTEVTRKYLVELLDIYGNPSSNHKLGADAKNIIENSRRIVAKKINANFNDVYFTPGGSASNTLGIKGYYDIYKSTILYSPILHKSATKCIQHCGKSISLEVDSEGFINLKNLRQQCEANPSSLVVVDYANSEIGTIQDLEEIIKISHSYDCKVYADCTASISTVPLDIANLDVDMCGFSGHKIGALKGCGVFYKKNNIEIAPLVYGTQEHGLVGGTENVIGIASISKAFQELDYSKINTFSRDYVIKFLLDNTNDFYVVGAKNNRLAHNLCVCFKSVDAESLSMMLDINCICVSVGSACNNNAIEPSSTLVAIGLEKNDLYSCIRLSFSGKESAGDLKYVCEKIAYCVDVLRKM